MDAFYGYMLYGISLLTMGGIYAVLTLGLNVQWGFTGLFARENGAPLYNWFPV